MILMSLMMLMLMMTRTFQMLVRNDDYDDVDDDRDDAVFLVSGACGTLFRRETTDHRLRQAKPNRRRFRNESGFAELGGRQRLFLFQLMDTG